MSENHLRHWSVLSKTDPKHTQKFDRGRFKGTAIRPIYTAQKMTETFGPCGVGWGMGKPEFQIINANNEIVVYCTVCLWYMDGEQRGEVYGVGGDKVLALQKNGPFVNDEALKASFTDALSNAMKHLGMSADVHMGLFDDHKYVAAMQREFADDTPQTEPDRRATRTPPTGILPPSPEEPPEIGKMRQARTLYDQLKRKLETAVSRDGLDLVMEDARNDLLIIEDAASIGNHPQTGKPITGSKAAAALRTIYARRVDAMEEKVA